MRLNGASEILHKKHTNNTLSYAKLSDLANRGLINFIERGTHDDFSLGFEELFMMLPTLVWKEDKMYLLKMWVSAFGVAHIGYCKVVPQGDTYENDILYSVGLDDVTNERWVNEYANFVDIAYALLVWVDDNYPNELKEYKDKVQHTIKAM